MWTMQSLFALLGASGAARNAGSALDAHRDALAEVDSLVARLQHHASSMRPAA
jgi:hypothetical protein